ncbi:hypothetical protein [Bordetella trematum]|uniref:hypothetical protein n=1 Tax=Bordetella trematum TaxID=123899 RepID=UPI00398938D2
MDRSSHALLHKQGFLRTGDLDAIGPLQVVLAGLSTPGQLARVGCGLYRLPGNPMPEHGNLVTMAVKVPKAVADCFKHRNQLGQDEAIEALKAAWKTRKEPADALWRHAKDCRVANVMRPYLEAFSHE